ncbi:antibiotic biosynthesis monooxygenase family protein [Amycolatopsis circi]|uniref:antibiotic biosynthesis monooxygenase family protein n=1 Tax=Amycolatopsis circi TaxID=871959 RepID=UPI000E25D774|nr:antibiotic biosynthesis monooxygenase family protein [Amycolatopsis circi]
MIVLVNKMTVLGSAETYERLYERAGRYMEEQPGLIRYQLARSQKQPDVYFNVAEWETAEAFEQAARGERFAELLADLTGLVESDQDVYQVVFEGAPTSGE